MKAAAVMVIALSTSAHAQSNPSPAAVLAKIQEHYATVSHQTSLFRQTVTNALGMTTEADGKLLLAAFGAYRFDYLARQGKRLVLEKTVVSDGKTQLSIEHAARTYHLSPSAAVSHAIAFFFRASALADSYTVTIDTSGTYGSSGSLVLELSRPVERVFLVVDPRDWHVTESVVVDPGGEVTDLRFFSPDTAKSLPAAWLHVVPPFGYARVP